MADQDLADQYFKIEVTQRTSVPDYGEEVVFYSRRAAVEEKPRRIREKDVREAVLVLVNLAIALIVPRRHWTRLSHHLAGMRFRKHVRKRFAEFADSVSAVTGESGDQILQLFRAVQDARHRRIMLLAAELTRLRWKPQTSISGIEGLEAALTRGNGAIIWCNQFTAQNLMGKRALHEAGIAVHQVSVSEHGFSNSAFAKRFLNPILIGVENRYLAGRIVFDRGDAYQVTKRIASILKQNGVVLVTNNVYSGSTFIETRFGAAGYMQFASTPLSFAVRGGAALFSMSTFETRPFEAYEAVIGAEIPVARSDKPGAAGERSATKVAGTMARALLAFRDRFEADLRSHPEQFRSWPGRSHPGGTLLQSGH